MKLIPIPKKKRSLRAIDQGTRYDITGQLRSLVRRIESGEYGEVRHVVVGISAREADVIAVTTLGFGRQTVPEAAYTVEMMKRKLTGE